MTEVVNITKNEFERFQQFLLKELGIRLNENKSNLVQGRLTSRMRRLGVRTFDEYFKIATGSAGTVERDIMVHLLTTHETRFFRDRHQYAFLESLVGGRQPDGRRFRVWSAACSTGEEPYSIAMILASMIGNSGWEVVASDVSRPAVEKAMECLYEVRRQADIPDDFLKRFCLRGIGSMKGFFTIEHEVKERVLFRCINLVEDFDTPDEFDVIFLSNVLIYFDREARRAVVEKMRKSLRIGGFLIVGSSESLNGITEDLEWVQQSVYRRAT